MLYDENISLTGRIVSPGEAQYDSARQAFNTFLIDSLCYCLCTKYSRRCECSTMVVT